MCQLDAAVPSVVAANGGAHNILRCTNITIEVAGLKVDFPFLVAEKQTQDCIIGADFNNSVALIPCVAIFIWECL